MIYQTKVLVDILPKSVSQCPFSYNDMNDNPRYCSCEGSAGVECVICQYGNAKDCPWLKSLGESFE